MDYKIVGSVIGAVLFVVAAHIASQFIYAAPAPSKAAYVVPGVPAKAEAATAAPAPAVAETVPDFATVLPMADAMAGEAIAERCGACHDWLWKVSGSNTRSIGSRAVGEGKSGLPTIAARTGWPCRVMIHRKTPRCPARAGTGCGANIVS